MIIKQTCEGYKINAITKENQYFKMIIFISACYKYLYVLLSLNIIYIIIVL